MLLHSKCDGQLEDNVCVCVYVCVRVCVCVLVLVENTQLAADPKMVQQNEESKKPAGMWRTLFSLTVGGAAGLYSLNNHDCTHCPRTTPSINIPAALLD